ncbi:MAG: enoyl-CoA hydratase/isomerase family protein [Thermoanaerobaculia bacterium]|jgi:enoyl-CoA hydratase
MIQRDNQGDVAILRLAHGKANALDVELLGAIEQELGLAHDARAVVLTGTASMFCAGVDLFRLLKEGSAAIDPFLDALEGAILKLFEFPAPVVAAVNGHAIAGGGILVEACDYRIMSGGKIGIPELLVGVPFPVAALEVVRFATPAQHIQKIAYTGRTFGTDDALAHGMIDEIATPETLEARALEVARQFGAVPRESFALAKRTLREPTLRRIAEARASIDRDVRRLWANPATHALIRTYLDKTVGKK